MRFLIIKPSSLGDIVHTLPAARIIKKKHPDAHLSWLVNDSLRTFLELSADVDEILVFRRREWGKLRNFPDFLRFLRQLSNADWDCVIDFQGLFRSGVCSYFAGDRSNTFGFADARELAPKFYGRSIPVPEHLQHAVDKNIFLVNQVLQADEPYAPPRFKNLPELEAEADQILAEHHLDKQLIAVAPASRWPSKTWPPSFFAAAIAAVRDSRPDVQFWLLGTETDIGKEVLDRTPGNTVNLMGRTSLPLMVQLLRRSRALLTNDSGPMHIAAALGVPTVALFGPTSPEKTGPYGQGHRVLRTKVDCAPCLERECPLPRQLCRDDVISPALAATELAAILDG